MPYIEESLVSCGIHELYELSSDPIINLTEIGRDADGCAIVVWSDVFGRYENGNLLYHYIRKHFPRSNITRSRPTVNPNSSNRICIYSWIIPKRALSSWMKKHGKYDEEENSCCSLDYVSFTY